MGKICRTDANHIALIPQRSSSTDIQRLPVRNASSSAGIWIRGTASGTKLVRSTVGTIVAVPPCLSASVLRRSNRAFICATKNQLSKCPRMMHFGGCDRSSIIALRISRAIPGVGVIPVTVHKLDIRLRLTSFECGDHCRI
jgi:hypothetical protein